MKPTRILPLLTAALLLGACKPPAVDLKEEYPRGGETKGSAPAPTVDHSLLDRVLKAHVDAKGFVDYTKLHGDRKQLDAYVKLLGETDFAPLGRDEKLALLINAYNAFTLALILDHWPLKSIKDIPEAERWKAQRWKIGSLTLSLDQIEHEYLRPKFKEPRIHFAVNCASIGCPPLRDEAYRAADIDRQLQEQALRMHRDPQWVDLDAENRKIKLTKLYDWFSGDFEQVGGTVLDYAAKFEPELAALLREGKRPSIEFLEYDWNLNGK